MPDVGIEYDHDAPCGEYTWVRDRKALPRPHLDIVIEDGLLLLDALFIRVVVIATLAALAGLHPAHLARPAPTSRGHFVSLGQAIDY